MTKIIHVTTERTQILTNKRITPRVGTEVSSATPTINTDNYDVFSITALATAITSMTTNLSGTPTNGDKLLIRIKDDGTARTIAWGTSFEAGNTALPTTTVANVTLSVGFIYNSVDSKWACETPIKATSTEINGGSDDVKFVTADGLATSYLGIKYVSAHLNGTTALTTSEKVYFRVPAGLTGMNLVSVTGSVGTGAAGSSSSGVPTFTVKNVTDNNQMLSTSLTIDAGEYSSADATAAVVIDTTKDDVVTDDLIEVAVTTAGTGVTYAVVTLGFRLP